METGQVPHKPKPQHRIPTKEFDSGVLTFWNDYSRLSLERELLAMRWNRVSLAFRVSRTYPNLPD